jgi:hypothetical protein
MNMDELALNLREAYRLVHSYQCAVLDLAADIAKRLDLDFYYWAPDDRERPCTQRSNPTFRSAWEMLPLHSAWITFVSRGSIKPGSYMLLVWPQADTALGSQAKSARATDADLLAMPPATKSKTQIVLWHATVTDMGGTRKNESFWSRLYDHEWPRKERFKFDIDDVQLRGGLKEYPWSAFADGEATQKTLDEFKRRAGV